MQPDEATPRTIIHITPRRFRVAVVAATGFRHTVGKLSWPPSALKKEICGRDFSILAHSWFLDSGLQWFFASASLHDITTRHLPLISRSLYTAST